MPPSNDAVLSINEAAVAQIDILGYRDLVRTATDRNAVARRLDAAIANALEWLGGRASLRRSRDGEWKTRVFSDCICSAKPATDVGLMVFLEAISHFSKEMFSAGFPVRGGIAVGPYAETELLLFSEAQIEAYDLEATQAHYPRIVLSQNLIDRLNLIEDDDVRLTTKEYVAKDEEDSHRFVNYLVFEEEDSWQGGHHFFWQMLRLIEQGLSSTSQRVREKYEWMGHFHNWALAHAAQTLKGGGGILDEDNVWDFPTLAVKRINGTRVFSSLVQTDPAFRARQPYPEHYTMRHVANWITQWPYDSSLNDLAEQEEWIRSEDVADDRRSGGLFIRMLRLHLRLTADQVAREADVSGEVLAALERGNIDQHEHHFAKVMDWLLWREQKSRHRALELQNHVQRRSEEDGDRFWYWWYKGPRRNYREFDLHSHREADYLYRSWVRAGRPIYIWRQPSEP